ncbi:MAG: hypothetical protein WBP64_17910 [Nitrososphaeraceae archaeon]|jgi:hypothetical protein
MSDTRSPEIQVREHPNFRTINVNGVFGGPRGMYFDIVLFSDESKVASALSSLKIAPERTTINRTLECRLIIDPLNAKAISQWLMLSITEYEKQFGRIPSPEELLDKHENMDSDLNKSSKTVYQ